MPGARIGGQTRITFNFMPANSTIYFDIETGPMPLSELIIPPFVASDVKLGNIKNPDLIAEKIQRAEETHVSDYIRGAALDALSGQILCIGYRIDHDVPSVLCADTDGEAEMLKQWWRLITSMERQPSMIGFNVKPDRNAAIVAEREEVDIRHHTVIYNVTDEITLAMAGLLDPTFKEVRLGIAAVREVFKTPKVGAIAGCMVTEGLIRRGGEATVRVLRGGAVVHEGKIAGLRRFKDDVSEVKSGFECGISIEKFNFGITKFY